MYHAQFNWLIGSFYEYLTPVKAYLVPGLLIISVIIWLCYILSNLHLLLYFQIFIVCLYTVWKIQTRQASFKIYFYLPAPEKKHSASWMFSEITLWLLRLSYVNNYQTPICRVTRELKRLKVLHTNNGMRQS